MYKISQAIYQDGNLILSEKLSPEMEGRQLQVIILDATDTEEKVNQFFETVDKYAFTLPEDYRFDRDELYDR